MKPFPESITDPVYHPPPHLNNYQKFWLKHIHDKRDLPFVTLFTVIHLTIVPTAILLFTPLFKQWWWAIAIIYFYFSQFYFKGSYGLMLHCICHRKFFKSQPLFWNKYVFWFVSPLFGHLGDSYQVHHIGMHHIENNMPNDTSSTMAYTRDNFFEFLKYWIRFMFLGVRDVIRYLFPRKRQKMYIRLTVSEVGFAVIATALCFVSLKATLIVLLIPFIFARLVMMMGNWTQHAFVDPVEPDNDLASNIICLNTSYNHKCWNDGYHAIHHVRPGAHYTDIPVIFRQLLPEIQKHKTIVFEKIHYLHIFVWLMFKRYDKLADHMVNINETFTGEADAISLLKSRTKRFDLQTFGKAGIIRREDSKTALAPPDMSY